MLRKILFALILIALIIYGVVVHNWWVEGSRNFQRTVQQ